MLAIVISLAVVVVIAMIILSIILYNFMLLTSELNKRMVYIVSDMLNDFGGTTPHLDTLFENEGDIEDDYEEEITESFNPHNFDPIAELGEE